MTDATKVVGLILCGFLIAALACWASANRPDARVPPALVTMEAVPTSENAMIRCAACEDVQDCWARSLSIQVSERILIVMQSTTRCEVTHGTVRFEKLPMNMKREG